MKTTIKAGLVLAATFLPALAWAGNAMMSTGCGCPFCN